MSDFHIKRIPWIFLQFSRKHGHKVSNGLKKESSTKLDFNRVYSVGSSLSDQLAHNNCTVAFYDTHISMLKSLLHFINQLLLIHV